MSRKLYCASIVGLVCAMAQPGAARAQSNGAPPANGAPQSNGAPQANGPQASNSARQQARDIGGRGFEALDRGQWRDAKEFFLRADALYHASPLLMGIARAEVQMGELVEAVEHYQRILDEGPKPESTPVVLKAVEAAKHELGPAKARCARVVVRVAGPPAGTSFVVTIDGAALPNDALGAEHLVNPGAHRIAVRADGYAPAETSLTLGEGESHDVALSLAREGSSEAPAASLSSSTSSAAADNGRGSSMQRTLGFASLGVGGAGLLTGAVTGIMALSAKSSLSGSSCPTGCDRASLDSYQSDLSRYHTTTALATVGFTVAALGGIAGAVLILTAPQSHTGTRAMVTPYVGVGSVGATGRF